MSRESAAQLLTSYGPAHRELIASTNTVSRVQEAVLHDILRRNETTWFGVTHGFSGITTTDDFRTRVPIASYDDYRPAITRIAQGDERVLVAEPSWLQPTSGSTSGPKSIPFTASLKQELLNAVRPWLYDLYTHIPALGDGVAYWSITPLDPREDTASPVGFANDLEYFEPIDLSFLKDLILIPDGASSTTDWESYRFITLLALLRAPKLRMVSVWNPSFLSVLLDGLASHAPELERSLRTGRLPEWIRTREPSQHTFEPDEARADTFRTNMETPVGTGDVYSRLFPDLALISCWTHAQSERYARHLSERFPAVPVQGKGLFATEGVVSIPLFGLAAPLLAVTSHFYEFLDTQGQSVLAHELTQGDTYEVLLTTSGGLYRYRLNDVVRVEGFLNEAPLLRFMGRADATVDLFGEKLNEGIVRDTVETVLARHGCEAWFFLVAPEEECGSTAYTLFVEWAGKPPDADRIAYECDTLLRKHYHYDHCRRIGQLQTFALVRVTDGARAYLDAIGKRGRRLGDIKPPVLDGRTGWKHVFTIADD